MHILSPVTDRAEEEEWHGRRNFFMTMSPRKNVPDIWGSNSGPLACQVDTFPIELLRPAHSFVHLAILQKFYLFSYLGFAARQDYFTHFEPSQSQGEAKTGDPQEKPPDHPQAVLGLSHVTRARLEPSGEMMSDLECSKLAVLTTLPDLWPFS